MSIPILSDNFLDFIRQHKEVVVVEFFATWCPKCAMMAPVYERIASSLHNQLKFYKVDVDQAPTQVALLGINIYPTFIVYQNGVILGYTAGVLPESTLKARIIELAHYKKR